MQEDHGKFCWYELMTTDVEAAERFYASVVGWSMRDAGMPNVKYTVAHAGDSMVAGVITIPDEAEGMPPAWIGYIYAEDIDATASDIAAKGGTVHRQPDDIPGVGRFAVVADPHGAVFSLLHTSDEGPPAVPMMTPGHIGWHELMAGELDTAWTFYSSLFGWTKDTAMDMGDMGVYQLFAVNGGDAVGGMMAKSTDMPAPPYWGYYFVVEALDAAVERLTAGGGSVLMGPMEVPGGAWVVNCLDPQGAYFSLVAGRR
jgi:predicted enzyme related to lactoylglutathione lyase